MSVWLRRVALCVVLTGLAMPAFASVDAEVTATAKVKGAFASDEDVARFRFDAVRDSLLTVTVKGDARAGVIPSLRLLRFDGEIEGETEVGAEYRVDAGSKIGIKRFPLPLSGTWILEVTGSGAGGYALSLKAQAPKKLAIDVDLPAEGVLDVPLAAAPGSALALVAKAAKGSPAVPRFQSLEGEGDPVDLSGEGKIGPTSHAAAAVAPEGDGEFVLRMNNDGGGEGDVLLTVKIKSPKTAPTKLDLRDLSGHGNGGEGSFASRTIGESGGTVQPLSGGLSGARLDIPSGALPSPTVLSMASVADPSLPDADDQRAGPALDLQPSGLRFDQPALLTLPYNPAWLPALANPSDLRVLVVEDDGSTLEVTPSGVDTDAGTISLPLSGFSVCIPIVRSGLPRIGLDGGGEEYWFVTLETTLDADPSGNDSRARGLNMAVGEASFFADGKLQLSSSGRHVQWSNQATPQGLQTGLVVDEGPDFFETTWSYGDDGRTLEVADESGGAVFAVNRDATVLVEIGEDQETRGEWTLALRKSRTTVTQESLKGTWFLGAMEVSADVNGFQQPASVRLGRDFGTAVFDGKGGFKATGKERGRGIDPGGGASIDESENLKVTGTCTVQPDGIVLVEIPPDGPDESPDTLRFHMGDGGRIMFGVDDEPCGSCDFLIVLVRQGGGVGASTLNGDYLGATRGVSLGSYGATPGDGSTTFFVGDPVSRIRAMEVGFNGAGQSDADVSEHRVARDPGQAGGLSNTVDEYAEAPAVTVDSRGGLKVAATPQARALSGAVTEDGGIVLLVSDPDDVTDDFLIGVLVKAPPGR